MPTKKEDLPSTLKRSPEKVQNTYAETLDSAEETYDSEARAHRAAWSSVKHVAEKQGDHWELKDSKGPLGPRVRPERSQRARAPQGVLWRRRREQAEGRALRAGQEGRRRRALEDDQGRARPGDPARERPRDRKGARLTWPTQRREPAGWDELSALVELGREAGCINASALSKVGDDLELDDDQVGALQQRLEDEGISVTDDCGITSAPPTAVTNHDLAVYTTDALQQFLNEARPPPLLTPARGDRAGQARSSAATWAPRSG